MLGAMTTRSLGTVARRSPHVVARVGGEPTLARRLAALGVRRGVPIQVLHGAAGGGFVVAVAGARLALDRSVIDLIEVGVA